MMALGITDLLRAWAEQLGWKVWASDLMWKPDHTDVFDAYDPEKHKYITTVRVYILKNPFGVMYADGQPLDGTQNPDDHRITDYKVPRRSSESEAWADLPKTRDEIWQHSAPPKREEESQGS